MAASGDGLGDDRALVAGAVAGDTRCYSELYRRYHPRVRRFLTLRLRDPFEAEDLTQDVFVEVLRSLPSFRGDSQLSTWLLGIAYNRLRLAQRRRRPSLPLECAEARAATGGAARPEGRLDARRALRRCDEVLEGEITPHAREAFRRWLDAGQSLAAIADSLGTSPNAVKCSLQRTRRHLDRRVGPW